MPYSTSFLVFISISDFTVILPHSIFIFLYPFNKTAMSAKSMNRVPGTVFATVPEKRSKMGVFLFPREFELFSDFRKSKSNNTK